MESVEMSKKLVVPDYLKAIAPSADVDSLASSSTSVPRISLKGKKFRKHIGGEDIDKPSKSLDVVILGVQPSANLYIKSYYEGAYAPGDTSPPKCGSSDGLKPDPWVVEPMSNKCISCPMNQFGSATSGNGKKAKACKDSKRLWVAMPEDVEGTVYALGIPVTSLKNIGQYARELKVNGFPISGVITRMTMDEEADFPILSFEVVGFLEEKPAKIAIERNIAKDWDLGAASAAPMLENSGKSSPLPTVKQAVTAETLGEPKSDKPTESTDTLVDKW